MDVALLHVPVRRLCGHYINIISLYIEIITLRWMVGGCRAATRTYVCVIIIYTEHALCQLCTKQFGEIVARAVGQAGASEYLRMVLMVLMMMMMISGLQELMQAHSAHQCAHPDTLANVAWSLGNPPTNMSPAVKCDAVQLGYQQEDTSVKDTVPCPAVQCHVQLKICKVARQVKVALWCCLSTPGHS